MKSIFKRFVLILSFIIITSAFVGCDDTKSYAELLQDENKAVNRFLADQKVIGSMPADTVFVVGEDAPYYQIDNEGNLYMQVIRIGDEGKVQDDQLIYFRFIRYNLLYYSTGQPLYGEGNAENIEYGSTSFRYGNFTLTSSSQWGEGIQVPLKYLPIGSEVKIVIKSQFGWTSEIANVVPFLYHVRYYRSQI